MALFVLDATAPQLKTISCQLGYLLIQLRSGLITHGSSIRLGRPNSTIRPSESHEATEWPERRDSMHEHLARLRPTRSGLRGDASQRMAQVSCVIFASHISYEAGKGSAETARREFPRELYPAGLARAYLRGPIRSDAADQHVRAPRGGRNPTGNPKSRKHAQKHARAATEEGYGRQSGQGARRRAPVSSVPAGAVDANNLHEDSGGGNASLLRTRERGRRPVYSGKRDVSHRGQTSIGRPGEATRVSRGVRVVPPQVHRAVGGLRARLSGA